MAKKQFWFRHEYWGDEWQEFDGEAWDHDDVASKVAEDQYDEEPCDPYDFEMTIEVKDEKNVIKFISVSAEADVNFYSREVDSA